MAKAKKKRILWKVAGVVKEWDIVIGETIPDDLMLLIVNFVRTKSQWYKYKLELTRENAEDLEQDLIYRAITRLVRYDSKRSSLHTYLDRYFTSYFKDICNPKRPSLRSRYGKGDDRIMYDSEHPEITGEPKIQEEN